MRQEQLNEHRGWLALLAASLIVIAATSPVSNWLQADWTRQQTESETARDRLDLQLRQWREDAATAKTLSASLSQDDIDGLLAPADRAGMTAQIEPLAAAARLTHVTYTLAPAAPWQGGKDFPGIEGIAHSELVIEADAPSDDDIFTFIDSLSSLAGKFELDSLTLSRLNERGDAPVAALNLHMKAVFQWYANEDAQK